MPAFGRSLTLSICLAATLVLPAAAEPGAPTLPREAFETIGAPQPRPADLTAPLPVASPSLVPLSAAEAAPTGKWPSAGGVIEVVTLPPRAATNVDEDDVLDGRAGAAPAPGRYPAVRPITGVSERLATGLAPRPRPQDLAPAAAVPVGAAQRWGGLIVMGFQGRTPSDAGVRRIARDIREGRVAGVLLMGHNITSRGQVRSLIAYLKSQSALTPIIAVDQEGGKVQRLGRRASFTRIASAKAISGAGPDNARTQYERMAAELSDVGVNYNFGPVVDVEINPRNPVIARFKRSYGPDPEEVTTYAGIFLDAHARQGIATALKHFPGHGSSARDSHNGFVDITRSWQESELTPYRRLVREADSVMIGHVSHSGLSGGSRDPATFSPQIVKGILRGELGFQGVVVTDDMEMAAIRERWGLEDAAVLAAAAGIDLLLYSNTWAYDPGRARRLAAALERAVAEGRLSEADLLAARARVDRFRARLR